ncbi:F-box/kelch-repeat protein At1g15670-like [Mercurialis annua]|uniref:F-box/kelch-repeat protein At1g15670-like n=1 Tax=Mercurialis annua TaxID=3986 RepID=UPI00215E73FC|nr:F-box/kelch-repeat protein At1g15670-like [Mercurialis annua]
MTELIPGLPEEIALECLTRFHYSTHRVASRVCKNWKYLLQSRDFYYHRKQSSLTHKAACLIQSLPSDSSSKPVCPPRYGVTLFDPVNEIWELVEPVPEYPDGLPLFCKVTSSEGKVLVLGGWDPVSYEPVSHVFVYDFVTRKWRKGKDIPDSRSFFAVGELDGRVIVAGGHDLNKNALSSAWVYDVTRDEWSELPRMSQERDECEGVVIGSKFWVVSGYRTENQGEFEASAEFIDLEASQWNRVEDAWKESGVNGSPKSCLGVDKSGKLLSWAGPDSEIKVGACGVQSEEWVLVSGSAYLGGPQEFFFMEGQNGKWKKLNIPDEFSGFAQSACFAEI